ncbi:hypothetical protein ACFX1X_022757 [Malus domestica]
MKLPFDGESVEVASRGKIITVAKDPMEGHKKNTIVPSIPEGHPIPRFDGNANKGQRVSSLICSHNGNWNLEPIANIISQREHPLIMNLPLEVSSCSDRLIWPMEKNGVFIVHSGYYWLHAVNNPNGQSSPSTSMPNSNLVWKALHRALATMAELFKRRSAPTSACPLCLQQDETIEHLLLLCPWVEAVWFGGQFNYRSLLCTEANTLIRHITKSQGVLPVGHLQLLIWIKLMRMQAGNTGNKAAMSGSANRAADWLTSFKNTRMCISTWVDQPCHILNRDGLPCPP